MQYKAQDHVFAVCAYKENEFLEECVKSLVEQSVKSNIIICTATPNDYISGIAERHNLPIYINTGRSDISGAWNFAFATAQFPLVTIVHQDDVYEHEYLKETLAAINSHTNPLICFTDSYELRKDKKVYSKDNKNLRIKEYMLFFLRAKKMQRSKNLRRFILSIGNPICCPSVTYVKDILQDFRFDEHFENILDWDAWERISNTKGEFCYVHKPLLGHRIHSQSITTQTIENNIRNQEELEMFRRFWPAPIAKRIASVYKNAQKQNQL